MHEVRIFRLSDEEGGFPKKLVHQYFAALRNGDVQQFTQNRIDDGVENRRIGNRHLRDICLAHQNIAGHEAGGIAKIIVIDADRRHAAS